MVKNTVPILFICPSCATAACTSQLTFFRLVVNRLYSTWKPVKSGLLEGPVLFNISNNDLEEASGLHMTPCWVGTINKVKTWTSFTWTWATGMAQQEPSETQHQQMQSPVFREQISLTATEARTDSSGALVGSELSVNQCPGCREGQQPTLSARVWPIDQESDYLLCSALTGLHLNYCTQFWSSTARKTST